MELAMISNFHHQRPHGDLFDPKLNAITTEPQIYLLKAFSYVLYKLLRTPVFVLSNSIIFRKDFYRISNFSLKFFEK